MIQQSLLSIPKGNEINASEKYLQSYVHCSIIKSQNIETM